MSTFGRRGSRESGWNWSRPPGGARPPAPPPPPLLPLAGAALLFAAIVAALLAVWLSGGGENPPQDATATPVASATATRTPTPTATAEPSPTPTPGLEPRFRLAAWDGSAWQPKLDSTPGTFREGQAIPFMLRIEETQPGDSYGIIIRFTCRTLPFFSGFDRDSGSGPAIAPEGPQAAVPDSTAALPDDPATTADDRGRGRLSLWGGSFGPLELADVNGPCADERSVSVKLVAGRDDLFLLWGAVIAPGAAGGEFPVRITVTTPRGDRRIEIDPVNIVPAP